MIRVVVVEDHQATLKGLSSELSKEPDIEVCGEASLAEKGLELARQINPDVVLLDLHLPDSPGPNSLSRGYTALENTKVIVFSGDDRQAIVNLILETGVNGFLLKSEPIERVVRAIREVLNEGKTVVSESLLNNDNPIHFTEAEEHLLRLLARGMKYREIAEERVTAPETVRKQVDALIDKLSLDQREELIAWAVDNGYGNIDE